MPAEADGRGSLRSRPGPAGARRRRAPPAWPPPSAGGRRRVTTARRCRRRRPGASRRAESRSASVGEHPGRADVRADQDQGRAGRRRRTPVARRRRAARPGASAGRPRRRDRPSPPAASVVARERRGQQVEEPADGALRPSAGAGARTRERSPSAPPRPRGRRSARPGVPPMASRVERSRSSVSVPARQPPAAREPIAVGTTIPLPRNSGHPPRAPRARWMNSVERSARRPARPRSGRGRTPAGGR